MPSIRSRNKVWLIKKESTEGVDAAATVAANLMSRPTAVDVVSEPNIVEDNELRGGIGAGEPVIGGTPMRLTASVNLNGCATPGTAPEWGPLLEACGYLETLTATAVPSSGTGTCDSGTATTATLSAAANPTFSATNGAYVGMLCELGGNPATPAVTQITAYTKVGDVITVTVADSFSPVLSAVTTIKILPNALYSPHSGAFPSLTSYLYNDATLAVAGVLEKTFGLRGSVDFLLTAAQRCQANLNLQGTYGGETDVVLPATPVAGPQAPIWLGGRFSVERVPYGLRTLTLNTNAGGVLPPNPNPVAGFDPYEVTSRNFQGTADPKRTLVATANFTADLHNATKRIVHAIVGRRVGGAAGSRIAFLTPEALFRQVTKQDDQGLQRTALQFQGVGVNNESYICVG